MARWFCGFFVSIMYFTVIFHLTLRSCIKFEPSYAKCKDLFPSGRMSFRNFNPTFEVSTCMILNKILWCTFLELSPLFTFFICRKCFLAWIYTYYADLNIGGQVLLRQWQRSLAISFTARRSPWQPAAVHIQRPIAMEARSGQN